MIRLRTFAILVTLGLFALAAGPLYAKPDTGIQLKASLVNRERNAAQKAAVVRVEISGLALVDPGTMGEGAMPGMGYIHYILDNCPAVGSSDTNLSFWGLSPGPHTIRVVLVGNDHKPLGVEQTLDVTIP